MRKGLLFFFTVVLIISFTNVSFAADLKVFSGSNIKMKIPDAARVQDHHDYGQGWTGPYIEKNPLVIEAFTKSGVFPEASSMLQYLASSTAIPLSLWQLTEQSQKEERWVWKKAYQVSDGVHVAIAAMGHSKSGAYIFLLITTVADFNANHLLYTQWYQSIRVS